MRFALRFTTSIVVIIIAILVIVKVNNNKGELASGEFVEVPQPIQMVPVLTEEQKEIEQIKKRPSFKEHQNKITDLLAEQTFYTEEQKRSIQEYETKKEELQLELQNLEAQHDLDLADFELKFEELRAKELDLGL